MMIGQPGVGLLLQSLTCKCYFSTSVLSAGLSFRAGCTPVQARNRGAHPRHWQACWLPANNSKHLSVSCFSPFYKLYTRSGTKQPDPALELTHSLILT